VLRTHHIWGDPLRGRGNIEPDPAQLPPRAGRVLRCSTGGRADAALRRLTGLDIGQINFILHAINCILRVDICVHKPHNFSYGNAIGRSTQPRKQDHEYQRPTCSYRSQDQETSSATKNTTRRSNRRRLRPLRSNNPQHRPIAHMVERATPKDLAALCETDHGQHIRLERLGP